MYKKVDNNITLDIVFNFNRLLSFLFIEPTAR